MNSLRFAAVLVLFVCVGRGTAEKGLCHPACELPEVCEPCDDRHCCRYPDGVRHWGKWCCYRYCQYGQVCATSACHEGSECKWPWHVLPGEPFESDSSAALAVAEYLKRLEEGGDGEVHHGHGHDSHDGSHASHDGSHAKHDGSHAKHDGSHASHDVSHAKHDSSHASHDGSKALHDGSHATHASSHNTHDGSHASHDGSHATHDGSHAVHDGSHATHAGSHAKHDGTHATHDDSHSEHDSSHAAVTAAEESSPAPPTSETAQLAGNSVAEAFDSHSSSDPGNGVSTAEVSATPNGDYWTTYTIVTYEGFDAPLAADGSALREVSDVTRVSVAPGDDVTPISDAQNAVY
ncbi:filaggrin-like isoform X2 [Pollicipes pollicipes]|uniref:filaggrin-like isoform X2 n=1 Tax=Pollicipes pollicipes TaxID=41117 RepID=UPI001884D936|nr:filaggrin-like isoform X2 [Pollicipes pollicipes]